MEFDNLMIVARSETLDITDPISLPLAIIYWLIDLNTIHTLYNG